MLSALSGATGENADVGAPVDDVGAVDLERFGGDRVVIEGPPQCVSPAEPVRRRNVRIERSEVIAQAGTRHDVHASEPQRSRQSSRDDADHVSAA